MLESMLLLQVAYAMRTDVQIVASMHSASLQPLIPQSAGKMSVHSHAVRTELKLKLAWSPWANIRGRAVYLNYAGIKLIFY